MPLHTFANTSRFSVEGEMIEYRLRPSDDVSDGGDTPPPSSSPVGSPVLAPVLAPVRPASRSNVTKPEQSGILSVPPRDEFVLFDDNDDDSNNNSKDDDDDEDMGEAPAVSTPALEDTKDAIAGCGGDDKENEPPKRGMIASLNHDNAPGRWYDHIRRYSTAVILASVFGVRGASFDSPQVSALYHVQDQFTQITELGATPPVDIFPWLKRLPNVVSSWRKWAYSIRTEQRALYFSLMQQSKRQMQKDDAKECFLARLIKDQEKSGLSDEHIAYLGGTLMEAGSDTTASTLLSFLLAMANHPDVLRRCQEEVDALCGVVRSPAIDDLDQLPYVRAVMNETLRWRPVAAGGIPHAVTEDDHYNGYFIPKGTILFANAWAIHRTAEFEDPEAFKPERFLHNKFGIDPLHSGQIDESKRRVQYGFGAGRRVCSGQRLAENSLIVNMAKLVWGFNIKPEGGRLDDDVATSYHGGFLIAPKEFPLQFIPRSAAHVDVMEKEHRVADGYLQQFEE
ncbi:O-methylsterigmatocystin oxido [Cyphellophora attinorum]|uniref:O-methylsterigmatocystin oxido n=1 Tax=Cyphellophora attinorum TaxID=1664694 RepID=A0A0N1P1F2_9EURO|nr:O-methylsterigmatocystin oxido [Phialophora attinorum]KPI42002.1 O-methylsterigmatocystin oxido [Phialophora attinorum]